MRTLTLFNAYALACSRLNHATQYNLHERTAMLSRQRDTFADAIRARLELPWNDQARNALQSYEAAKREMGRAANDKDILRWREECRSYAVDYINCVRLGEEVKA